MSTEIEVNVKIKLKPCPFCGSTSIFIGQGGGDKRYQRCGRWGVDVFCNNCGVATKGVRLPDNYHKLSSEEYKALWGPMKIKAAEEWNRRFTRNRGPDHHVPTPQEPEHRS